MLFQNLIHLRRGVGRRLHRKHQLNLVVAEMFDPVQVENIFRPVALVGGEINVGIPRRRPNPTLPAEVEQRLLIGLKAGGHNRDQLISRHRFSPYRVRASAAISPSICLASLKCAWKYRRMMSSTSTRTGLRKE